MNARPATGLVFFYEHTKLLERVALQAVMPIVAETICQSWLQRVQPTPYTASFTMESRQHRRVA